MEPVDSSLTRLARRVVEPLGYELVGVQHLRKPSGASTLRVYIDHENGVSLDDCALVSHQLSAVLDVEDPLPGHYDLEVSSPGFDRPLIYPEHFQRFCGHRIRVRLAEKIEGRRKLEGLLLGEEAGVIRLDVEGREWSLPIGALESARLVPEF